MRVYALFATCLLCSAVDARTLYLWVDDFDEREQAMLMDWVAQTTEGLSTLTGPYPFDVHIRFHRIDGRSEPVPWANTTRGYRQGVNFHVDPRFSLERFLADWTAPHELSHLALPYLGRRYSWFAEGFASYMQYQVMHRMQALSWDDVIGRYRERMARAKRRYDLDHLTFSAAAPKLRASGRYPTMYWGGAILFLRADSRLRQESNRTLTDVITEYVSCCRMRRQGISSLIRTLDEISNTEVFSEEYRRFSTQSGFPDFETALDQLDRPTL